MRVRITQPVSGHPELTVDETVELEEHLATALIESGRAIETTTVTAPEHAMRATPSTRPKPPAAPGEKRRTRIPKHVKE